VSLQFPVAPMMATLGVLPAEADDHLWSYEIKWDGYRTLAFVHAGGVRLQSRSQLDVTSKYDEVRDLAGSVNASAAVLDGELVCFDATGRPSFEALQRHTTQAVFHAFDVLSIDGNDTVDLPYEQRRSILLDLVEPGDNWLVPAHRIGDGAALLAATLERGMEGVMAKRLGAIYQIGKRSPLWRKVKNRQRVTVTIGGFSAGSGTRSSRFGALLVGVPGPDGLRFAGGVGTGFTQRRLDELQARLTALQTTMCPFDPEPPREYRRGATWVRPELSATVEIAEFTNDGLVRQASFIGLTDEM
jgi:bifunctional non-homologous end joining protein LigD